MSELGLRVDGLHVRYGRKAVLHGLDLAVPKGATTVLLGANGSGKSTLLRACIGELRPSAGAIHVAGWNPRQSRAHVVARCGFVPDVPDVPKWMTPKRWYALQAAHRPGWSHSRVAELAAELDVPLTTRFRSLSRGQGMKAMLVGALGHDPDVLLLDEPFGGIDIVAREAILRSVIGVLDGTSRTVLVTTHDLDVAARIADRVAMLADGVITREGTLDEIVGDPGAPMEGLRTAMVQAAGGVQ